MEDTVNKRLTKFVKSVGYIRDVAKDLDINEGSLANKLRGDRKIDLDLVIDVLTVYDNLSADWLLLNRGEMLRDRHCSSESTSVQHTIPLLPVSAQGGSLNEFITSIKDGDCERLIPPIRGADFALTVAGDSMAPEYPSGSIILVKKIDEKLLIDWGHVYVLDTSNGAVVKQLFPTDDPGVVNCRSINPGYPPFEVSLSDVYGVYRVLMCMILK